MLNQIKQYATQEWQLNLESINRLSSAQLSEIALQFDLTKEQCLFELLPLAANFALVPISNFHVGAIAVGLSGTAYWGANMEFSGIPLSQTIHAEQAAINHAWLAKEKGITDIYVNESPCGHCRQFMNELTTSTSLKVHVQAKHTMLLNQLLPQDFGPDDLGITNKLMAPQDLGDRYSQLTGELHTLWQQSYAPYTQSPAICVVTTASGACFYGAYAENAAFNPSIAPLQSALVELRLARIPFEQITQVVLYESKKCKISQKNSCYMLLQQIAPQADWMYEMV